jgi:RNA polymerase sigma factor (sigma-70 family)
MRRSDEGMSTGRECVRGKFCPKLGCAVGKNLPRERYRTMSKAKKMNGAYAGMNIIPAYEWTGITQGTEERCMRYLAQQVLKVARAYHLSESERDELAADMTYEVRLAVWKNFNPKKARYATFFARVLHRKLIDWQRKEMYRRDVFAVLTPAREEAMNEVADESPFGDVFEIVARRDDIQNVRRVLGLLSPESRRVCELYMETNSLNKVAKYLKQDTKTFFYVTWPRVKKEFLSFWEKVKVM